MPIRIGLSKKTRFDIFERDAFICRYCGKSPPDVKLVIDHVHPVCEGGTNEPANLITSCDICNSGKGPRILSKGSTDANDKRRAQEYLEQHSLAVYVFWQMNLELISSYLGLRKHL